MLISKPWVSKSWPTIPCATSPTFWPAFSIPSSSLMKRKQRGAEWDELAKYMGNGDAISPIFCFLLESVATGLRILRPAFAAPCVNYREEESLQVPAPRSPEPLLTFAFPNQSVFYTELSWADIGMHVTNRGPQSFHDGCEHRKKAMGLFEREPGVPICSMHQSKVELS